MSALVNPISGPAAQTMALMAAVILSPRIFCHLLPFLKLEIGVAPVALWRQMRATRWHIAATGHPLGVRCGRVWSILPWLHSSRSQTGGWLSLPVWEWRWTPLWRCRAAYQWRIVRPWSWMGGGRYWFRPFSICLDVGLRRSRCRWGYWLWYLLGWFLGRRCPRLGWRWSGGATLLLEENPPSDRTPNVVPSESRVSPCSCGGGRRTPLMRRFDRLSGGIARLITSWWDALAWIEGHHRRDRQKYGGREWVLQCLRGLGRFVSSCRSDAIGARRLSPSWRWYRRNP